MRSLGDFIQKMLFNTTLTDVLESIDGLRQRIEELNQKHDRELNNLRQEIERLRAGRGPGGDAPKH